MYKNPYQHALDGHFQPYKTNFHTHCGLERGEFTCGELPLADVLYAYERNGYQVLCVSNHDEYTDTRNVPTGMSLLQGVEYSADPHMLTIGVQQALEGSHQSVVDQANALGGFVILCHPNWQDRNYWSMDALRRLNGYTGIEIVNSVIYELEGSGVATDKWDTLLSEGRLVWGFGNDDFHFWQNLARTWNVIYAASPAYEDIKEAVQNGRFYVSTGLCLQNIELNGNDLCVHVCPPIPCYPLEYLFRVVGKGGKVLYEHRGSHLEYTIPKGEPYVRVEATMENGAMLFLQPIYQQAQFDR